MPGETPYSGQGQRSDRRGGGVARPRGPQDGGKMADPQKKGYAAVAQRITRCFVGSCPSLVMTLIQKNNIDDDDDDGDFYSTSPAAITVSFGIATQTVTPPPPTPPTTTS